MIVYGKNVAKEYLHNNKKVNKIYIQRGFSDKAILSLIEKRKLNYEYLDKSKLAQFEKKSHQGIILDVEDFAYSTIDEMLSDDTDTVIMLDHIEDPHNLGAIIRTSEAAGIKWIIIPKDRSALVNSTVMKTSAGAVQNINIALVTNLNDTIKKMKKAGFWIVGTDMDGTDYHDIDYSGKTCIIIGNEGKGISKSIESSCDFIAKIPMYGKINSLNASVAAGIIMFEAVHLKR